MEIKSVTEILEGRDYTKLLYGTYAENPTWVSFLKSITEVFNASFGKTLIQLANVRVPQESSREVNILSTKNFGLALNNTLFTNEEYIRLLDNLKLYERKKGTKYYLSLLGLVKNAHFIAYPLWTTDYQTFVRDNYLVRENSILKDYKRITAIPTPTLDYGFVYTTTTNTVDYGLVSYATSNTIDYGEVTEVSSSQVLPDVNDPSFYINKYYPTSHVDLEYDSEKYPISEDDIRYLFYKVAPANLVLNYVEGIVYSDPATLYIKPVFDMEFSYDTFPCFAGYEGELYTAALDIEHSYDTFGSLLYNSKPISYFDKLYPTLPLNFTCYRETIANWLTFDMGQPTLNTAKPNTIRYIKDKGILLENSATNLLKYSTQIGSKQINLGAGTYTISSFGTTYSRDIQLSGILNRSLKVNEDLTFTTNGGLLILNSQIGCYNIQIENTPYSTSPILNPNADQFTRTNDSYVIQSQFVNSNTAFMKFRKRVDETAKSYVLGYGRSFTDGINILIENNKLQVVQTNSNLSEIIFTTDYTPLSEFGITFNLQSYTTLPQHEYINSSTFVPRAFNFALGINMNTQSNTSVVYIAVSQNLAPSLLRIGSDWLSRYGFNGYLTHYLDVPNSVYN